MVVTSVCVRACVRDEAFIPYRCAVLHHGVVELVALGGAPREEAALAHVIVEVLQTAIPEEGREGQTNEGLENTRKMSQRAAAQKHHFHAFPECRQNFCRRKTNTRSKHFSDVLLVFGKRSRKQT